MRRKRERDKVEGCVSRSLLRFAPIVSCFLSLKPLSLSPHLSQEQPGRTQVLVYADELVDLEGGHEREARGGRERPASSCCSRHRRRRRKINAGGRRKINAGGRRKKVKFFFFFVVGGNSICCSHFFFLSFSSPGSPTSRAEKAKRFSTALDQELSQHSCARLLGCPLEGKAPTSFEAIRFI